MLRFFNNQSYRNGIFLIEKSRHLDVFNRKIEHPIRFREKLDVLWLKIYAYQCTWYISFEGFLFYNWILPVFYFGTFIFTSAVFKFSISGTDQFWSTGYSKNNQMGTSSGSSTYSWFLEFQRRMFGSEWQHWKSTLYW